jgi:hypothetical protein
MGEKLIYFCGAGFFLPIEKYNTKPAVNPTDSKTVLNK